MTDYTLCEVEGCQNKKSIHYCSEFRGSWCNPCMAAQRIIDGANRRQWARDDRRVNKIVWTCALVSVGLAVSFFGIQIAILGVIAAGIITIAVRLGR